jgi:hypothetical protein
LPAPKQIGFTIGNHEFDLLKGKGTLIGAKQQIVNSVENLVNANLINYCYYIGEDLVVSHGVMVTDIPEILKFITSGDVKSYLPEYDSKVLSDGKIQTEELLSLLPSKGLFDLINLGARRIMTTKPHIGLCDAYIFNIPSEARWIMELGFDKLNFRNIFGHQVDNLENYFRMPREIDGCTCFGKFIITDACQCVSERENVARNPDISPARFLQRAANSLEYECCGANISNSLVRQFGLQNIKKQIFIPEKK